MLSRKINSFKEHETKSQLERRHDCWLLPGDQPNHLLLKPRNSSTSRLKSASSHHVIQLFLRSPMLLKLYLPICLFILITIVIFVILFSSATFFFLVARWTRFMMTSLMCVNILFWSFFDPHLSFQLFLCFFRLFFSFFICMRVENIHIKLSTSNLKKSNLSITVIIILL